MVTDSIKYPQSSAKRPSQRPLIHLDAVGQLVRFTFLVWNVFSFNRDQEREADKLPNRIEVDPGEYDPVLGHSYGEIAGMSRSLHRSQGMGASERKGSQKNFLVTVAGDPATRDVFDGVDTTWDSVPGSGAMARLLAE